VLDVALGPCKFTISLKLHWGRWRTKAKRVAHIRALLELLIQAGDGTDTYGHEGCRHASHASCSRALTEVLVLFAPTVETRTAFIRASASYRRGLSSCALVRAILVRVTVVQSPSLRCGTPLPRHPRCARPSGRRAALRHGLCYDAAAIARYHNDDSGQDGIAR
jgi:hypothetical protein